MPLCAGNDVFKNLALCATQWCFSFYESVRRTGWNSIIKVNGKLWLDAVQYGPACERLSWEVARLTALQLGICS